MNRIMVYEKGEQVPYITAGNYYGNQKLLVSMNGELIQSIIPDGDEFKLKGTWNTYVVSSGHLLKIEF